MGIKQNYFNGEWVDGVDVNTNINLSDAIAEYTRSDIRVEDYDEALAVANDTDFGLSAGICTKSLKFSSDFRRNSEAGMGMINLPTAGVDYHVPFGGRKGSSYGSREQGRYAQEF